MEAMDGREPVGYHGYQFILKWKKEEKGGDQMSATGGKKEFLLKKSFTFQQLSQYKLLVSTAWCYLLTAAQDSSNTKGWMYLNQ